MQKKVLKSLLAATLLLIYAHSSSAQDIMSTIAGTGISGYSGDGALGTAAELKWPTDVCVDGMGNVYVADRGNFVIRKVHAISGIITTIAGNGMPGYSGDGGAAINATFMSPSYICIDQQGNIYISDGGSRFDYGGSSTIRKINIQTGIITTVAGTGTNGFSGDGGLATAAQLKYPTDIEVDQSGNLFIVDRGNNRIRKVNAQTGIIKTIAGQATSPWGNGDGGPALVSTLNNPAAITITNGGDIYFSDNATTLVSYIRKIDASSTTITTVAGEAGYFMEAWPAAECKVGAVWGMACDDYGNIYIGDESCSCRVIDSATGLIYRIAGDTLIEGDNGDGPALDHYFNFPLGICINRATGDLFIADNFNYKVRKVTQPDYIPYIPEVPQSVTGMSVAAAISIFPNPATDKFIVKSASANGSVQVCNSLGSIVYQHALSANETSIDMQQYPAGNYYVTTIQNGKRETQKLILVK